jgi:hypothetical protein
MELHERLLEVEEGFWNGDAHYYDEHLAEECVMVFSAPVGVMEREAILESISESRRWMEVALTAPLVLEIDQVAVVLTYLATARREGDETSVSVYASSLYVSEGTEWKLAFHQQTPG